MVALRVLKPCRFSQNEKEGAWCLAAGSRARARRQPDFWTRSANNTDTKSIDRRRRRDRFRRILENRNSCTGAIFLSWSPCSKKVNSRRLPRCVTCAARVTGP